MPLTEEGKRMLEEGIEKYYGLGKRKKETSMDVILNAIQKEPSILNGLIEAHISEEVARIKSEVGVIPYKGVSGTRGFDKGIEGAIITEIEKRLGEAEDVYRFEGYFCAIPTVNKIPIRLGHNVAYWSLARILAHDESKDVINIINHPAIAYVGKTAEGAKVYRLLAHPYDNTKPKPDDLVLVMPVQQQTYTAAAKTNSGFVLNHEAK